MKINGQPLQKDYSRQIELPRPDGSSVLLRLQPLPLGFHRRIRQGGGMIAPAPPARIARDSSGRPLRDERGVAIMLEDEKDKTFLDEWELHHQRLAVLIVAKALEADTAVVFETPIPTDNNWADYADQLYAELESANFSAGDLIYLCEEVCRMSNLAGEHLSQATTDFIPPNNS